MNRSGPQTVKSVVVVNAYKVIATQTPAVRQTASIINLWSYLIVYAATIQLTQKVKIINSV